MELSLKLGVLLGAVFLSRKIATDIMPRKFTRLGYFARAGLAVVAIGHFSAPVWAQKAPVSSARRVDISELRRESFLSWLPDSRITQSQVFAYLQEKVKEEATHGEYPANDLMKWSSARYEAFTPEAATKDSKSVYRLIQEDLSISQGLLKTKDIKQKKRGLRLAAATNSYVFSLLGDKELHSKIYEGFILPSLEVASNSKWEDISIQRLAEGASNSFERSEQPEKQISLLRLLLTSDISENTRDWAHSEIAQALASTKNYREAIFHLQQIESKSWEPMKNLIPKYQTLLADSQK